MSLSQILLTAKLGAGLSWIGASDNSLTWLGFSAALVKLADCAHQPGAKGFFSNGLPVSSCTMSY